ncbi:MAG: DUF2163 domain-containing protein [Rhizobiales bacterium]|nr:DUF2163 domain-containing protein [Hyphomicrobiales bacterium]
MRTLPDGLQAHLDSGATTMCHCWRLIRNDGLVLGFTDHDHDLNFDGTDFVATGGFEKTDMVSGLGLGIDNLDVAGALQSERLDEDALSAGLFDNAVVEIFTVNWQELSQRLLIRKGNLGEVTRSGAGFSAEIRGIAHELNQPQGRVYQYVCDADLGDARCGIALADPLYSATAAISNVADNRLLQTSDLAGYTADWFTRGLVTWTNGANASAAMEVKSHRLEAGVAIIELWQPMRKSVLVGDMFAIQAGCNKLYGTCRDKFSNGLNFRGFPHMPGNDFVVSYPNRGETRNDGGSFKL